MMGMDVHDMGLSIKLMLASTRDTSNLEQFGTNCLRIRVVAWKGLCRY